MEKIIQIDYQGRNFSIEENAYFSFQTYEKELQSFFTKEEAGDEIFADLQYRMAEILDQKNATGNITQADINELIAMIGKPSDFDQNETKSKQTFTSFDDLKKKLFRDKKDKIIAGVCSGIANYFSIDPIAIRLIFVLFTLFNIITFLSFNIGLLVYIICWVILTPASLEPNVSKKLFRNPKDKVLGGVCSGLAQFFNLESWIIRLLFVAPILLGIVSSHSNFSIVNIELVSHSFYSLSFMSYMLLWFIIPLAKVNTDYMLLKGEPINLSTIQNSTTRQQVSNHSQSSFNKLLKVVAYFIIAILLIVMIPTAIGILIAVFYSYNMADIVLFTQSNKIFALLTLAFFIALPIIGLITWGIRKIIGAKPNRIMTATIIGLNIIGWTSLMFLIVNMVKQNNTYSSTTQTIILPQAIDELNVGSTDTTNAFNETIFLDLNQMDFLMEKKENTNEIKAISIDYDNSSDTSIVIEIEKSSFGENRSLAFKHAEEATFSYILDSNQLNLPAYIAVSNKQPYYLQNVHIRIKVPKGKKVITSKKYLRQINTNFHSSKHGIHINHGDRNIDEDYIFSNDKSQNSTSENEENKKEDKALAKEKLNLLEQEHKELIKQKELELHEAKKQMQEEIDEMKKELKKKK